MPGQPADEKGVGAQDSTTPISVSPTQTSREQQGTARSAQGSEGGHVAIDSTARENDSGTHHWR